MQGSRRRWLVWLKWTLIVIVGLLGVTTVAMLTFKPWLSEKQVVEPLPGGKRIKQANMLGNFYPASGSSSGAVLVIGGSDGGISATADNMAKALSEAGFDAMATSYWGAPGQSLDMKQLPLEAFDAPIAFLKSQSAQRTKVAVMGYSKGAEAALLLGERRKDLAAIIAGAPSHVSWQAIDFVGTFFGGTSTFSFGGQSLPYMPYGNVNFLDGPTVFEIHDKSLKSQSSHPEAQIAVEKIAAPVMLLCGGKDAIWPACDMASSLVERAKEKGGVPPRLLAFPAAGHGVLGPPPAGLLRDDPLVIRMTRTPEEDVAARTQAWPQVIAFIKASFREAGGAAN
jgi:uncharacterized protein